ncbi:DUF1318 domain-containing protein [bacterium]|nr:DUF1318 domain-containing protein [bacterium]
MRLWVLCLVGMIVFVSLLVGCSIKAPEVRVTGERTALEQEVIGTYQRMEEDTWMIASTRAAEGEGRVKISPEKKKVLEAMQSQKFNKDDIDEFKKKGYVGENNEGLLETRPSKQLSEKQQTVKLVQEILKEENIDRMVVMERVIELNDSLEKTDRKDVLNVFARMNQDNSPKGTWIQKSDGVWIRK